MSFEVMEDCIHLKACRRVQAIGRKHRLSVPRYCTENCTAYVDGKTGRFLDAEEAAQTARNQYLYYDGRYDPGDVFVYTDFPTRTLSEIIEEVSKQ